MEYEEKLQKLTIHYEKQASFKVLLVPGSLIAADGTLARPNDKFFPIKK